MKNRTRAQGPFTRMIAAVGVARGVLLSLVIGWAATSAFGQDPAGCVGGVLGDPKAYFFQLIGRAEGAPAPDWVAVLDTSGIPTAPGPGVKPDPTDHYGITQQRNSAGQVRGRLFLPTDIPDDFGFYLHPIDVVTNGSVWAWSDWIGGPPYAPQPCPAGTPAPATAPPAPGGTPTATSSTSPASSAGCVGGLLVDPKAYFFALIGRAEGAPAPDWQAVMMASGLPVAPPPGVRPNPSLNSGITQQLDSSGNVRGRVFLPTDVPDAFGFYLHPIDVLRDDGSGALVWAWSDWIGGPPYAPQPCPSASGPPITASSSSSPGGTPTASSPTSPASSSSSSTSPTSSSTSSSSSSGTTTPPPPTAPQYTSGGNTLATYQASTGGGSGSGGGGGGGGCWADARGGAGAIPALVAGLAVLGLAFSGRARCARRQP